MTAEPTVDPNPSPLADSVAAPAPASGTGEGFFHADGDDLIPTQLSRPARGARSCTAASSGG